MSYLVIYRGDPDRMAANLIAFTRVRHPSICKWYGDGGEVLSRRRLRVRGERCGERRRRVTETANIVTLRASNYPAA